MFSRFFAAVRRLTETAEALAASLTEANDRFRSNVLDAPAEQPALPAPAAVAAEEAEEEPTRRGNGRRVAAKA